MSSNLLIKGFIVLTLKMYVENMQNFKKCPGNECIMFHCQSMHYAQNQASAVILLRVDPVLFLTWRASH